MRCIMGNVEVVLRSSENVMKLVKCVRPLQPIFNFGPDLAPPYFPSATDFRTIFTDLTGLQELKAVYVSGATLFLTFPLTISKQFKA